MAAKKTSRLRSREWFDIPGDPSTTALHIERYTNFGISSEELRSGKPIIGIAQTGSDLVPCNRIHINLALRVREGIREAGGIALEFPVHPIQESGKRPTAALDRNLQYLGLVEVLFGYPIDGVVLTIGCDKTTPALLMAASTVDIPSICLSSGPMMNGYWKGERAGSGTIVWKARKLLAAGEIDEEEFIQLVVDATTSPGYCNTMGTATTMNSLAEGLGMSLPGPLQSVSDDSGRVIRWTSPDEWLLTVSNSDAFSVEQQLRAEASDVQIDLEPPRTVIEVEADDPVFGPSSAAVEIIEFSDFQCPFCQRLTDTLEQLKSEHGSDIRLVFKDYPLPNHAQAFKAAEAGNCANQQGMFWELHDTMFSRQSELGVDDLKRHAGELGMDQAAFDACLDSGRFAEQVNADLTAGQQYGVSSTPTVFINGRAVMGAAPFEMFDEIIREELERAQR